ncbi:MAG: AAA family ATPase [Hyphomonadaceae bacterium]
MSAVKSKSARSRARAAPDEETRHAPVHARRPRQRSKPSLAAHRMRRALARQWLPFLAVAVALGAVAALFFRFALHTPAFALLEGAAIGAGVGLLFVFVREVSRNTITTLASLDKHRGYAVIGAAPELTLRALRALQPDQRSPFGALAYLPASPFATAFRDLQGQVPDKSVVAFLGSRAGEGATTAAVCTAASATQQGRRVIVLDCDLRHRSLTDMFDSEPMTGLLHACAHPGAWRDHVEHEAETGVAYIPIAVAESPWRSVAEGPGLAALIEHLREAYDCVLLDCPPASSADGPAIARLADQCIVVAAWDETPLTALRATVRQLRGARGATSIFVNRVPPEYRFGRLRPD